MDIFSELLDSYSKLRKRRYSLSEALLEGHGGSRELSLNRQFPEGSYEEEDLKSLLKTAKSPSPGVPVNIASPFFGVQTEDPGMIAWRDYQGNEHSASQDALIQYLELRLNDEGEEEQLPPEEDAAAMDPMSFEDSIADSFMKLEAPFLSLAESKSLNLEVDDEFREATNLEFINISEKLKNRRNGSQTLFSQIMSDAFGDLGEEDFGDEAVQEFVNDFKDFLGLLKDAANQEEECFEVKGLEKRKKLLDRFFTRSGGTELVYGSLNSNTEKPLLSAGIAKGKLADHYDVSRYHGTHFTSAKSLRNKDNPILKVINSFSDMKKCDSSERLISSTGAKGGGDWSGARADVDETSPIIADYFARWINLKEQGIVQETMGHKLTKALELSLKAINLKVDKFVEVVRDAYGVYDDAEKMFPPIVADAEEFLEQAFGDKLLDGVISNEETEKLSKLVLTSYLLPELKLAYELRKVPGFVRTSQEFVGVPVNRLTGTKSPSDLPGGISDRHEKVKADSIMVFKDESSALSFLQSYNSTYTPVRLRSFWKDEVTGEVAIPREHKNVDPAKQTFNVAVGKDAISKKGIYSRGADEVYETHIQAMKEKGVNEDTLSKARAMRSKEKYDYSRVSTAFKTPTRPAGTDPEAWIKNENTIDSILGDLHSVRDNVGYPLQGQIDETINKLKKYQQSPNQETQRRNLEGIKVNVLHTLGILDGNKPLPDEKLRIKAVMSMLNTGASTHEKLISFKVGARGDFEMVPQSVVFDDLAANILNGTDDIRIIADNSGFKFKREGNKTLVNVRYRYRLGRKTATVEVDISPEELVARQKKRRSLPESQQQEMKSLIRESIIEFFEEMFVGKAQKILQ